MRCNSSVCVCVQLTNTDFNYNTTVKCSNNNQFFCSRTDNCVRWISAHCKTKVGPAAEKIISCCLISLLITWTSTNFTCWLLTCWLSTCTSGSVLLALGGVVSAWSFSFRLRWSVLAPASPAHARDTSLCTVFKPFSIVSMAVTSLTVDVISYSVRSNARTFCFPDFSSLSGLGWCSMAAGGVAGASVATWMVCCVPAWRMSSSRVNSGHCVYTGLTRSNVQSVRARKTAQKCVHSRRVRSKDRQVQLQNVDSSPNTTSWNGRAPRAGTRNTPTSADFWQTPDTTSGSTEIIFLRMSSIRRRGRLRKYWGTSSLYLRYRLDERTFCSTYLPIQHACMHAHTLITINAGVCVHARLFTVSKTNSPSNKSNQCT